MEKTEIVQSLKKMLPIWAILMGIVLSSLAIIHFRASHYLESGLYSQDQAAAIADIHYFAGERIWSDLAQDASSKQDGDFRGLEGEFSDDPRILEASNKFTTALEVFPTVPGAHRKLAQLEFWKGDKAASFYHLGMEFRETGDLRLAKINLSTSHDLEPENLSYAVAVAQTMAELEQWDELGQFVENSSADFKESVQGQIVSARYGLITGNSDMAFDQLDKIITVAPSDPEFLDLYLDSLAQDPNVEKRTIAFMDALRNSPTPDVEVYHRLAIIFSLLGNWELALESIDTALFIKPNGVALMLDKSLILLQLDRKYESRRFYDKALSTDYSYVSGVMDDKFYSLLRLEFLGNS